MQPAGLIDQAALERGRERDLTPMILLFRSHVERGAAVQQQYIILVLVDAPRYAFHALCMYVHTLRACVSERPGFSKTDEAPHVERQDVRARADTGGGERH